MRILVGRARHQASALSAGLRDLGADVLEIPFIEIRKPRSYKALDTALKNLSEYDWLILTSVNGVEALWERLRKLRIGGKPMRHLKVAAIGPATRAGHRAARSESERRAQGICGGISGGEPAAEGKREAGAAGAGESCAGCDSA